MKSKSHKGFTPVNKLINDKLKAYKLEAPFYKHQALKYWQDAACKFIDQAHEHTRAIDLKNGVLVIASLSKEIAYQIKLLAHRIIDEINKLVGKAVVFAIHIES